MKVAARPRSRDKIRHITVDLRKMMGIEKVPYFPIVQFIEWILGDPENDFDYEIVKPSEMEEYGTTNTGKNVMLIREDVYERAVKGCPRDRFTLCHELGHYLLHQPDDIVLARGDSPIYKDPEWQANVFAAELMAPHDLINGWSVEEVMNNCGMSRQAATIQLKQF